jgi:hypothetical protein
VRLLADLRDEVLASAATSAGKPRGLVGIGIEVLADPFCEFGVALVPGICERVEELSCGRGAHCLPLNQCQM